MKPGGGRAKGHKWEREVANLLKPIFPEARRGLSQTRDGNECADVEGTPFHVECKRGRKTNIKAAMAQALADIAANPLASTMPVIVTKDDHEDPLATMRLSDWLALVAEWHSLKQQSAHLEAALDEVMAGGAKRARRGVGAAR